MSCHPRNTARSSKIQSNPISPSFDCIQIAAHDRRGDGEGYNLRFLYRLQVRKHSSEMIFGSHFARQYTLRKIEIKYD